jgi:predicted RNA-binding protein
LDLFTGTTWKEFVDAGGRVSGFRESRWKSVQQMKARDYLLCYLTRVGRFIGVLEVTSAAFRDRTQSGKIWKDEVFPCRVKVNPIVTLTPETAVPLDQLKDQLTVLSGYGKSWTWTGHFRGSPTKWKAADGEAVVSALQNAQKKPIVRPVEAPTLLGWPKRLKSKTGLVTVPEKEEPPREVAQPEPVAHTEVQWRLAKLGCDMSMEVWVARNDRGKQWADHRFTELPRLRSDLPVQFDEATNRTIELIDVLWLRGNAIVAAFEIESTTSIYSGLLRLSDLIAMQPNLKISLYLVAPDERRDEVIAQVNRPTFSLARFPPMNKMCRFISAEALRDRIAQIEKLTRYLSPEFLVELSESCEITEP